MSARSQGRVEAHVDTGTHASTALLIAHPPTCRRGDAPERKAAARCAAPWCPSSLRPTERCSMDPQHPDMSATDSADAPWAWGGRWEVRWGEEGQCVGGVSWVCLWVDFVACCRSGVACAGGGLTLMEFQSSCMVCSTGHAPWARAVDADRCACVWSRVFISVSVSLHPPPLTVVQYLVPALRCPRRPGRWTRDPGA